MFSEEKALLLDMNNTFMFGEDNFSAAEDFSIAPNSLAPFDWY